MSYLTRLNLALEKCMPFLTPFSLVMGVCFASFFGNYRFIVPWAFAFLTFSGSLGCGFRDILTVFRRPVPLIATLLLLHLWTPLTAHVVGSLLFGNSDLVIGMVLQLSIPTAVVGLIWVSIYRGNSAFSLSLVLIDTLLSPLITPLAIKLFVGSQVSMDPLGMISDLMLMIALPAMLAVLLNHYTKGHVKSTLAPCLAPFSKLSLMLVVMINSSRVAPFFASMTGELITVALVMLILSAAGFLWGWITSRIIRSNYTETVSITFGSGMRNISAGAVIAAQYFPAEALFPVIISTVFQQVLAALAGLIIQRVFRNNSKNNLTS